MLFYLCRYVLLQKHKRKTNPCADTVKEQPYSFSAGIFICFIEGSDRKRMTAVKLYPEGIGKHIVCIYGSLTAAALQTACRGEPRTPNNTISGNKQR